MNVLRFSDLVAQGRVAGQRVFIRADLNVPQDESGRITEDTRIRASMPCIRMALDAGAAVMVTSHLGRPTEGEFRPRRLARAGRRTTGRTARPRRAAALRLGRRRARCSPARWCCSRTAGSTRARRRTTTRWRRRWPRCATSSCTTRSAPRTAPRPAPTASRSIAKIACAGPLLAAEIDAITKALAVAEAAAGGDRRRLEGQHQADDPAGPGEQGRPAHRRRRHRQYLHARVRSADRHAAWPSATWSARRGRSSTRWPARGAEVPIPVDVVVAKEFERRRAGHREGSRRRRRRRPDPRHRAEDRRSCSPSKLKRAGTIVWNGPVGVFEFDAFAPRHRDDRPRHRGQPGVQHRRRRRHAGGDRQVRHRAATSATSRPAAAPFSRCWKARRCRRSRSSNAGRLVGRLRS